MRRATYRPSRRERLLTRALPIGIAILVALSGGLTLSHAAADPCFYRSHAAGEC